MPTPRETCSDCGGAAHEIRLLDTGDHRSHNDLEYTVPEAHRGFFLHRYPVKGKVVAFMCEACGRISIFGVPND